MPIYAPQYVALSLWQYDQQDADSDPPISTTGPRLPPAQRCYFRDASRPVLHSDQTQQYTLTPEVPVLPGSVIRLTFLGAHQRQVIG